MSAQGAQTGGGIDIEEGDLISDGRDNWTVHATDGPLVPDSEIVVERYDGTRYHHKRENISECECGQLVFGDGPCYGCFKTGGGE